MATEKILVWQSVAVALLLAAACVQPAWAKVFVCKTADGRTITSDRMPRECAQQPVRELRQDGSVRRVIEPPLSAEERAARAAQEKQAQLEREQKRAQTQRDIALMETYANEEEIEVTRSAALVSRQRLIDRATERIDGLMRARKRLDSEAEFYVNRKTPDKLDRAYLNNEALVQSEKKLIEDMRAEMARINERFDTELARFRQLVDVGARPLLRTSDGTVTR